MNYNFIETDRRLTYFEQIVEFVNFEKVSGDFYEFGVYGGRTLLMMSKLHNESYCKVEGRRLIGFDSFEGLPEDRFEHPNWKQGDCALNKDKYHPVLKIDEPVNPEAIEKLFDLYNLQRPFLVKGFYSEETKKTIDSNFSKAAIIHIDCDMYDSTKTVLNIMKDNIQEGTVIVFDDWFNFKGSKHKGEQLAFREFLTDNPEWDYVDYLTFATFRKAVIMVRRKYDE